MKDSNLFWGGILILLGVVFLLDNYDIMDFGDFFATFWPVILIIVGIKIILDRRRISHDTEHTPQDLNENNVFGDIRTSVVSDDFKGGTVNNVFGDITLDLTRAAQKIDHVHVAVNGIFGDITIKSSPDIALNAKASAVAGDLVIRGERADGIFPDKNFREDNFATAAKKITLSASIIFGSVNIY